MRTGPTASASWIEISEVGSRSHGQVKRRSVALRRLRLAQYGLVAEEVDKVNPELVARDDKNQIYTVRYEAVNAMLLNEFLKQHGKVEEQSREIRKQEREIDTLKEKSARLS